MEHYRSVFATAGLMILGLVTASHVAYPHDPEGDRRSVIATTTDETASSTSTPWVDPPPLRSVETEAAPPTRPATFTLLAPETVALFAVARPASQSRTAATPIRRQRLARLHAAPTAPAADARAPAIDGPQPDKAARVDLIGDLIRTLGLGRDS